MHSHKSQQTLPALPQSRADVDIQQLCTHTNHNRRYLPYHRVERMSTYNSCALTQITTDATCCLVMEITIICLCSPLVSTFRFYRLQRVFFMDITFFVPSIVEPVVHHLCYGRNYYVFALLLDRQSLLMIMLC